ncbi:MAG: TlpA disulfide reductase family protein [Saprospiraceae bacterium]|nr:TlpA disulfide reductase family protein [Saprospiraceae bacterium]
MIKGPVQLILTVFLVVSLIFLARYFYFKPGVKVAEFCPPVQRELANSALFDIQSLKGNYVLIDFWGSWCKPCREEAPLLKKFYSDWHLQPFKDARGLEVLSIAIESNRADWEQAVAQDSAYWPYHILELDQFNSALVKSFGIRAIPAKILLDPDLRILGIDQSFEEMNELLARKRVIN